MMTSHSPQSEADHAIVRDSLLTDSDCEAPLGCEPEGSSCCEDAYAEEPTCKTTNNTKWTNNLQSLLSSKSGLKSFQHYLIKTNRNHFQMLRFLFACKGLSEESPERIQILLRVIYTKFIVGKFFELDEDVRKSLSREFDESAKTGKSLPRDIFAKICANIEDKVNNEMFPNFSSFHSEKIPNSSKPSKSTSHDCKKHYFESCHLAQCLCKNGRAVDMKVYTKAKLPEPNDFFEVLKQKLENVKNEETGKVNKDQTIPEIPPLRDVIAKVASKKSDENIEDMLDKHIDRTLPDENQEFSSTYEYHKYMDNRMIPQANNLPAYKDHYSIPHPYNGTGPVRRKNKDMYSMFSSDSGFMTGYYSDDMKQDPDRVPSDTQSRKLSKTWDSKQTLADSGTGMTSGDEYSLYRERLPESKDTHRTNRSSEGDVRYKRNFNTMSYRDRHNYINDIPSVSMNSLHSVDSYAQVEEQRRRQLRHEMKQKLKSPSWYVLHKMKPKP